MGFAFLIILVLSAALLITGNQSVYLFFTSVAVGALPYLIMMKMGAKNQLQWEKLQISMPLKRKNMVVSFYLSILIAMLAGLLLCGIILGIGIALHATLLEHVASTAFASIANIIGLTLLMAGLILPIGSTKFGENRGELFFVICMGIAIGIVFLINYVGSSAGIQPVFISLAQIVISAIVFIISYYFTRKIYAKMDF